MCRPPEYQLSSGHDSMRTIARQSSSRARSLGEVASTSAWATRPHSASRWTWRRSSRTSSALRWVPPSPPAVVTLGQDPWFLDADSRVRMKPDLVRYRAIGSPRAVIDAKYKRERPAGYPDADIYQMLAYCTALDLTDGHLVYAQGNDTAQSARVGHGGPTIHAHGLDLSASPRDLMRQVARLAERVAAPTEPRAIARPPAATR